jgi:predicted nucleic acid-binding protein
VTVAYFDSSALVKLVIEEAGSREVATLWDGADAVVTSRVAHPEVRAALAAAHRDRRLDTAGHDVATSDWRDFHVALRMVELSASVEHDAGRLAETHALSGFDAIHLASALTLADAPLVLATWDRRLLRAARTIGLATLPVDLRRTRTEPR